MNYGPVRKWSFPFQEKINIKTPVVRKVFFSLCSIIAVIFFVLFYGCFSSGTACIKSQVVVQSHYNFHKQNVADHSRNLGDSPSLETDEISKVNHGPIFVKELNVSVPNIAVRSELLEVGENETIDEDEELFEEDDNLSSGSGIDNTTMGFEEIDWSDSRLDLLHMRKPDFDPRFKNPCWFEPLTSLNPYENNTFTTFSPSSSRALETLANHWRVNADTYGYAPTTATTRLRCLPYFLIIGQPKCGSTDLFWKIAKHPDIVTPPIKELHWWSRNRQGRRFNYMKLIPFSDYIDMFDNAGVRIYEKLLDYIDDVDDDQIITGEASVSLFWDNGEWDRFPENMDQTQPRFIVPDYIQHFIPDVKLILILRNPVERMYSDYLYFHSTNKSVDDFHEAVKDAVDLYSSCVQTNSPRQCVYDPALGNKARVRLRVGMYSVFLRDWLRLFPLSQFHILRLEDYSREPVNYVKEVYRFLGLREIPSAREKLMVTSSTSNVRKQSDRALGDMLSETRALLLQFYRPYNEELAAMLSSKRYLWADS
ncbi:carbohydrate sulfotransferase 15-like [Dreissena polymorpha]|nr:carbohydrate sulfotransferase 15-like [Dreissena polymorpha]